MKSRLNKTLLLALVLPLLLGCNLSTLVGAPAAAPSAQPPAGPAAAAPTGPAMAEMEGVARQTVSSFLNALRDDLSGGSSVQYLTTGLQQQASGGVASMAGIQDSVPQFELSAVTFSPDAAQAAVDATLLYPQPLNRRFHLVREGQTWKIDQIIALETGGSYPQTPEEVVQAFLSAYQEAPNLMSQYLSVNRLAQMPPGGAVAMLDIRGTLEGSMIESAAVNPSPPSAAITVNIQSGGDEVQRIFVLTREGSQWKIDTVE